MKIISRILIACFLLPQLVHSVCLDGHPSPDIEYDSSPSVIIGKVKSVKTISDSEGFWSEFHYTIQVVETLKGSVHDQVVVFDENDSGRFTMDTGLTYLLFLKEEDDHLVVDSCGNSGLESERSETLKMIRNRMSTTDD